MSKKPHKAGSFIPVMGLERGNKVPGEEAGKNQQVRL